MRRVVLFSLVSAFMSLASIESVLAQTTETIGLTITGAIHNAQFSGAALENWTSSNPATSNSGVTVAVMDSQTNGEGSHGEYNLQASSETVAGVPGTTVSGLNLNSLAQSSISASAYGTAESRLDWLTGNVTATVQTASSPNFGTYIADGTVSLDEVSDIYTGTYGRTVIERDGVAMADIQMSGTTIQGFTTTIVNGQEQTVWLSGTGTGDYVPVQFITNPGQQLTLWHTVQLNSRVESTGSDTVSSQTWVSTLEDIQVTFHENWVP